MLAKLILKPYKSKQKADTASDEDEDAIIADDDDLIAMALAVRNESAGTELMYVPHWGFESVVLPDAKTAAGFSDRADGRSSQPQINKPHVGTLLLAGQACKSICSSHMEFRNPILSNGCNNTQ
jgi:hypothetical protein